MREAAVEPWQYLVRRQHPWRSSYMCQRRNMTGRQLVGSITTTSMKAATAADYHLQSTMSGEALAYVESNRELLETEARRSSG